MSKYDEGMSHYHRTHLVDLHDDWGMAGRSSEWKDLEIQLRQLHCKEYGHSFFPGAPYSWKEWCRSCNIMPEKCPSWPGNLCPYHLSISKMEFENGSNK